MNEPYMAHRCDICKCEWQYVGPDRVGRDCGCPLCELKSENNRLKKEHKASNKGAERNAHISTKLAAELHELREENEQLCDTIEDLGRTLRCIQTWGKCHENSCLDIGETNVIINACRKALNPKGEDDE